MKKEKYNWKKHVKVTKVSMDHVAVNLERLKFALKETKKATNVITDEDIDYNVNMVYRVLKYGK